MKKVIVTRTNGSTAGAEMEDPSAWIEQCIANHSWGKPERWVLSKDDSMYPESYTDEYVLESEVRDDGNGLKTWVKLRAEYTIAIIDVTYEKDLEDCIQNRIRAYPSPQDFLNAYFDGGDEALLKLKEKRLQIKAQFPKPVRPQ